MKSPPKQIVDDEAQAAVERFIREHTRAKTRERAKA